MGFDECDFARGEDMTASKTTSKSARSSKGGLGKATATLLTAAMILGTGLFISLGAATAAAGSGILIAMTIGGMICLATGISAAQIGRASLGVDVTDGAKAVHAKSD
jgi:amino acid permease